MLTDEEAKGKRCQLAQKEGVGGTVSFEDFMRQQSFKCGILHPPCSKLKTRLLGSLNAVISQVQLNKISNHRPFERSHRVT